MLHERRNIMQNRKKVLISILVLVVFLITATNAKSAPERVRVWVQYRPGMASQVERLLIEKQARFHYHFEDLESYVVSVPRAALEGLAHNPHVLDVEVDPVRYFVPPVSQNSIEPTAKSDLYTIDPNGQMVPYGIDAVQARDVWDQDRDGVIDPGAPTGEGIVVCIIDSGYYPEHEDLIGVEVIGGDSQVDKAWDRDVYGHATHIAGIVAAMNNALGIVGVTPGTVSFYIVKIFDDTGDATNASSLVKAAKTCEKGGADIISMSLGGSTYYKNEMQALQKIYDNGVLLVASAGNDGTESHHYPASYDMVVSVAATDSDNAWADWSQRSDQVELAAPGVGVISTRPYFKEDTLEVEGMVYQGIHLENTAHGTTTGLLVDGGLCDATGDWAGKVVLCERGEIDFSDKVFNVEESGGVAAIIYNNEPGLLYALMRPGDYADIPAMGITQEDGQYLVRKELGYPATTNSIYIWPYSGYEVWDGTSFSTPHVAAVAALVWSAYPTATNQDIRTALQATALDLEEAGRDIKTGFGLVQAYEAIEYIGEHP
jgi:serine protease